MWRRALVTCLVLLWPVTGAAQDAVPSPVLVIDQELYKYESQRLLDAGARLPFLVQGLANQRLLQVDRDQAPPSFALPRNNRRVSSWCCGSR